ncbi:MAG: hypothetical protein P1V36_14820, partial [Planctomycetota bacterium]|nr:hypothetical protein [Planctomycetota bacterium]
ARGEAVGRTPVRGRRPNRRYRAFDFGRVLSGTFTVYFKMLLPILVISLVIAGPVGILQIVTQGDLLSEEVTYEPPPYDPDDPDAEWEGSSGFNEDSIMRSIAVGVGAMALEALARMVLAGALAYLVVRQQQGRPVGIGEALGRGFARFVPILGVVFLVWGAMVLMFVPAVIAGALDIPALLALLILGAFVPMVMWYLSTFVAVPACAVERLGPLASIRRSIALCRGSRWLLLGLSFVMGLIGMMIAGALTVPLMTMGDPELMMWMQKAVDVLFIAPLGAVLSALTYVELRAVNEGVDADGIAEVFS